MKTGETLLLIMRYKFLDASEAEVNEGWLKLYPKNLKFYNL
jgi:hypothetical protein